MRRLPDGTWQYSPKDLIAWLEGDFAAWCEREAAEIRSAGGHRPPENQMSVVKWLVVRCEMNLTQWSDGQWSDVQSDH